MRGGGGEGRSGLHGAAERCEGPFERGQRRAVADLRREATGETLFALTGKNLRDAGHVVVDPAQSGAVFKVSEALVLAPFDDAPVRGFEARPAKAPSLMEVVRTVAPKPSFWLLSFGAACSSVCGYGVAFWLPSFFMRSLGLTLVETSWFYSGVALFGGVAGIWLGGWLGDRFGGKTKGAYALVPAICFLIALPCFLLAMNVKSLVLSFLIFLVPTGLNLAWAGPVITAAQHMAPATMRSTASALFLLINNLFGIAVGLWFFGFASDLLAPRFGAESMRYAIYFGLGFYVLSATLLILASRRLRKDWVD